MCHNHKLYYTYVMVCSVVLYNFWWQTIIGYYRRRNHERSLDFAIMKEKEWQAIKPKDEDEDEEDYGAEDAAVAGEAGQEEAEE